MVEMFCTACVCVSGCHSANLLNKPTQHRNHKPLSATHEHSGQKLPVVQQDGAHSDRTLQKKGVKVYCVGLVGNLRKLDVQKKHDPYMIYLLSLWLSCSIPSCRLHDSNAFPISLLPCYVDLPLTSVSICISFGFYHLLYPFPFKALC